MLNCMNLVLSLKHLAFIMIVLLASAGAAAQGLDNDLVQVDIIGDDAGVLPQYALQTRPGAAYRAYLQALKGERYGIRVRNRSNQRIGLVIAVDGRNIVSGEKSDLEPSERMYILGPRQDAEYRGWRTGRDKINRFFFSNEGASYAAAWDDHSALGVIAVAVYPEKKSYPIAQERDSAKPRARTAPGAGTGFGEQENSASREVEFEPQRDPAALYFIKYEWRDSLCEKQVITCAPPIKLSVKDVDVQVVDDRNDRFRQFPVKAKPGQQRAYLLAEPGARYGVKVRNRSRARIGLVIAVDGRNIISGEQSDLRADERMYVLEPGEEGVFRGWRTGKDAINRFFFTSDKASYAAAWGDYSALGVIAVAAFQERDEDSAGERQNVPAPKARSAPGTGFGNKEHAPSKQVEFIPYEQPFAQYFLKYEWRDSLCEKGVIKCKKNKNRLWDDDDGFAKPPPRNN